MIAATYSSMIKTGTNIVILRHLATDVAVDPDVTADERKEISTAIALRITELESTMNHYKPRW